MNAVEVFFAVTPARRGLSHLALAILTFGMRGLGAEPPNGEATPRPAITEANWVHLGSRMGPNGAVYTSTLDANGNLLIGGGFTHVGGLPAGGIARWNGTEWSNLAAGLVNGWLEKINVFGLATASDGTVFASGEFVLEGNLEGAYGLARWDGTEWAWLTDTNGKPQNFSPTRQLVADPKGGVYAADAKSIYHWDSHGLSTIGQVTTWEYSQIEALALDANGLLFMGGSSFTNVNEVRASGVAQWDGKDWRALGTGLEGDVHALLSDRPGQVYAAGIIALKGSQADLSVAHWNGETWEAVGSNLPGDVVTLALGPDGALFAGVVGSGADWDSIASIHVWNGTRWDRLPGEWMLHYRGDSPALGSRDVLTLCVSPPNRLFLGGGFNAPSRTAASGLTQWDGLRWSPVGHFIPLELDGDVLSLAAGPVGKMYAGGLFRNIGSTPVGCVAEWTGRAWQPVGAGVSGTRTNGFGDIKQPEVHALAVDRQGGLVAGGWFSRAGTVPASNVARWDGEAWQAMGTGLSGPVSALALGPDGAPWAGGGFGVARWDGAQWVGLGKAAAGIGEVSCMAFSPSGDLVVGAYAVLRWSGTQWVDLHLPRKAYIHALAFDAAGNLYVAGRESGIDNYFHFAARFDGNRWTALAGVYGANFHYWNPISCLAVDASGGVYMGGRFTTQGTDFLDGRLAPSLDYGHVEGNNLLRWNGTALTPVAGGVPGEVLALTFDSNGNLFAGGSATFGEYSVDQYPGLVSELLLAPTSSIDSLETANDGGVLLRGRGTPGFSYVLEATSQLGAGANWEPVATNRLSQPSFSVPHRPPAPHQFYRNRFIP